MDLPNRHCFTAIAHANQSSDGDGDYDDCDDDVEMHDFLKINSMVFQFEELNEKIAIIKQMSD